MAKRVTIRHVAEACGVSVYTVSSVMNNKGDISEKTSRKVWQTIRRLNYDPVKNVPLAKRLAARTLGLVLPDIFSESNPFFSRAINTMRALASRENQDLKLFTDSDLGRRLSNDPAVASHLGCDSFVFFCTADNWIASVRLLAERQVPVALIRRRIDQRGVTILLDDDYRGMQLAIEHLHQVHGHMRIALLAYELPQIHGRQNGYLDYVSRHGLSSDPEAIVELRRLTIPLEERLDRLYRTGRMTALACMTDDLAVQAAKTILRMGLRIPDDIALTGYNNDPTTNLFHPGITSVNIPVEEMVVAACQSLQNVLPSKVLTSTTMEFESSLVVRESCGCV